jgi:hypothetical protein
VVTTLLELFQVLASFQPARRSLAGAPWEEYVDWSIGQGLAPLAAYNLEFRMGGADAPEWARERLLSIYQGSINDTVMKLVSFKRALDSLAGARVVLLGGAAFTEVLYPHVGFRPLLGLELLTPTDSVDAVLERLRESDFRLQPNDGDVRVLSDGRTEIRVHSHLLSTARQAEDDALLARALPIPVYGPSMFRLDLEDAILSLSLEQARAGYDVPMLSFVDLRELLSGAPSVSGPYSRPPDFGLLKARAAAWKSERALFASASIVQRLFPEAAAAAEKAKPPLRSASRDLLDRLIISPVSQLGRTRVTRGADRLRRLLTGGGWSN